MLQNKIINKHSNNDKLSTTAGSLFYLSILTGFFFLLEISFFAQCNKAYLDDFNLAAHHLTLPLAILPGIIFFIFAQVLVHSCYCLFIWVLTLLLSRLLKLKANQTLALAISLWMIGMLTVLIANQVFFPYSKFSSLTSIILFSPLLTRYLFYFLLSINLLILSAAFLNFLLWLISIRKRYGYALGAILIGFSSWIILVSHASIIHAAPIPNKPNVIIIGADALRPDYLSFFGQETPTPFYDDFFKQASVFANTLTPLARTFPAWISILTGEYPSTTGARSDLEPPNHLHLGKTIETMLASAGYQTIYASDETRFSNIDKTYGFNQIITPPMGLNDFLLGTFNDFPLSNLLVNTVIGEWLFPYSYANRPVYFTYNPNTFLIKLNNELHPQANKPIFLAIHFCLTHAPYLWADTPQPQGDALMHYQDSVVRVDQQISDFMAILKRKGLLNHAIVILLSDHGEAFELPHDRVTEAYNYLPTKQHPTMPAFYPPSLDHESVDESVGHGTDVLGLTQYHAVFAWRFYGMAQANKVQVVPGLVSLLDIKPTLLQLLHMDDTTSQGVSLAPVILGKTKQVPKVNLFLESDFSPQSILTVYPNLKSVLLEGVRLFQIDTKTTRLTYKPEMINMILASKQFAVVNNHWILALYPHQSTRIPILVNLQTGAWTDDMHSPLAKAADATSLLAALDKNNTSFFSCT